MSVQSGVYVPQRAAGGHWAKGASGNPRGRSAERKFDGKTLPELARDMTGEALQTVREVMLDPELPQAVRLQAAEIVLRRGWGDAPRTDAALQRDLTVIVQQLTVPAGPVAGVLTSPISEHVCLPAAEVVDEVSQ